MFERFTDRARRVLVLAQEEAAALNHNFIGTEHILIGLVHEGEGVGAKALESLGVSLDAVRDKVTETIGASTSPAKGTPPFTPRAKKVLELSLREALQLGHNYIGTEHLLLGLIREGEGVAAQVLITLGLELGAVRKKVIELLSGYSAKGAARGKPLEPRGQFTSGGSRAMAVAQAAAGSDDVGTHHLLTGVLDVSEGLGAKVLASFGLTAEAVAARISEMGTEGTADAPPSPMGAVELVLAPGVKLTIEDDDLVGTLRAALQSENQQPEVGDAVRQAIVRALQARDQSTAGDQASDGEEEAPSEGERAGEGEAGGASGS